MQQGRPQGAVLALGTSRWFSCSESPLCPLNRHPIAKAALSALGLSSPIELHMFGGAPVTLDWPFPCFNNFHENNPGRGAHTPGYSKSMVRSPGF